MHKKTPRVEKTATPSTGDDTQLSAHILNQARHTVLRRVKLVRKYDVPYLAGYSRDGKTIYIDRDMPRTCAFDGRRVDVEPFLILHESVEKALVDQLGLIYQHAHQIALRVEKAAVVDAGIAWKAYDRFMQKHIKESEENPDLKIPPDLDLEPYRDEHDFETLKRMRRDARGGRRVSR